MFRAFLITFLLLTSVAFSQNVSGTVQDSYFKEPLGSVSVTLKNNQSGDILGTGTTDVQGNYSVDYTITAIENSTLPTSYSLSNPYPQPFNPSARFDFNTPTVGRFTARIYNILGQLVYSKSFTVEAGNHSLDVSGLGSAGVYIFNLAGNNFSSTKKMMLLDGGSGNVNVRLLSGNSQSLNKTAYDDLLIEFRKAGYTNRDSVVSYNSSLTIDADLHK